MYVKKADGKPFPEPNGKDVVELIAEAFNDKLGNVISY